MMKLFANVTLTGLIFTIQLIPAASVDRNRTITFEGTLLNYHPYSGIACGVESNLQAAKYRVDKILGGKYMKREIIVGHLACSGDVFKNIPIGSRVKITVEIAVRDRREYEVITKHPGVRKEDLPKIYYVAASLPQKLINQ